MAGALLAGTVAVALGGFGKVALWFAPIYLLGVIGVRPQPETRSRGLPDCGMGKMQSRYASRPRTIYGNLSKGQFKASPRTIDVCSRWWLLQRRGTILGDELRADTWPPTE